MNAAARRQRFDMAGHTMAATVAGNPKHPAVVLLHGFPNASSGFREIVPRLSGTCFVIAPDLPGSGESDVMPEPTFDRFADRVDDLLEKLGVGDAYFYVHDFGAPVALELAMRNPRRVRGLVVQNANAHRTGFGPTWRDTIAYWNEPSEENAQRATAHLTFEGVRDQYVGGIPDDIAERISADRWKEDWRVLNQPGRLDLQRALVRDYGNYVERFDDIARYLRTHQPPALLLWGRHDIFFDCAEVLSWLQDLPRMEAHVLDGPHLLLETHAAVCGDLIADFVQRGTTGPR